MVSVREIRAGYSPYQNGKQERFWATLEGRLMEMLAGVKELTLDFLNEATQAWVEMEYNRAVHRELGCSPVERFAKTRDVLRPSPSSEALRDAFRLQARRRQRQSDGTISLEGVRFEIPARYRHFRDVSVRYARRRLAESGRADIRAQIGTVQVRVEDRIEARLRCWKQPSCPKTEVKGREARLPFLIAALVKSFPVDGAVGL